jgi:hypothetical protein
VTRLAALALLVVTGVVTGVVTSPAAAQTRPALACAAPGSRVATLVSGHRAGSEALVQQALATPGYTICAALNGTGGLSSDTAIAGSLVVFLGPGIDGVTLPGANAAISSVVHGDVIVFGGDLFLEPGAKVDGRVVAIGGGVYISALASAHGGQLSERGARVAWHGVDTVAVSYWPAPVDRPALISLPVLYGLRIPSYDRVNGLSVRWGPQLNIDSSRLVFDPVVTYRSNLGKFDPKGTAVWTPVDRLTITGSGERGTFTNDEWNRPTIFNSVASLVTGSDTRNYFRADRLQLSIAREWGDPAAGISLQPSLGVRDEFDWTTGPNDPKHVPWSFLDRDVPDKLRRFNPPIDDGRLASALAGLNAGLHSEVVSFTGSAQVEVPFQAPNGQRFTQTTVDGILRFIALSDVQFQFGLHAVVTLGDTAPPQRFTYLGGGSVLSTLDILQIGGDEVLYGYGEFLAPLHLIKLPFFGNPSLGIFMATGSAGVQGLPHFTMNVGPRIALSVFELDWVIDPVTKFTNVGLGVNLPYAF